MYQLTLLTFQVLFIVSIFGFFATGIYYIFKSKNVPTVDPYNADYLTNSKKVERYILLSKRNTGIGILISIAFMILAFAVNVYK